MGSECANLVLTDGYAFGPAKAFTVESGEYRRTLATDEYATTVLPFTPDTETLAAYAFYELSAANTSTLTFDEVTSPVGGKPYLIVSKGNRNCI